MINFCVSFTTLPSRLKSIEKTIDSINNQSLKPKKIFLNLPYKFKRFPNYEFKEEQIVKLKKKNVEIIRCDDYGPGTKLMGSLDQTKNFDLVIILDDDHSYHYKMFEIFVDEFKKHDKNYSFYVQKVFKLNMGQGADGILINTKNLERIKDFYYSFVDKNKNLFLNDDLWISLYLQFIEKNQILDLSKKFKYLTNEDLVYKKHSNEDSLKDLISKGFINRRKIAKLEYIKFKIKHFFKKLIKIL